MAEELLYDRIDGWDRYNIHMLVYQLVQKINTGISGGISGYSTNTNHSIDSYCSTLDFLIRQLGWTDSMFKPDIPVNPPNGMPRPPGHYIWDLYQ